jgi:protoporphyrin/coproporphyrin ferrochelatase
MKTAVLLLAHGSPDSTAGMADFLRNVTGGRPVSDETLTEIQHRYDLIGHSPLTEFTYRQAQAVARQLDLPVYVGMRNWHPYIPDVVRQMESDGVDAAAALCMAPQNSRTSVGLYRRVLMGDDAAAPGRTHPPIGAPPRFRVHVVESWHDHPLLVRAFAEKLSGGFERACSEAGAKLPVIFTAHSVPQRTITDGDPYEQQARETSRLVADEAGIGDNWRFAFQSQGLAGGPWLGPTVEETILALNKDGHSGVFIQPIGFLSDHVEVLYDIDIAFRRLAERNGIRLWRAESLNGSRLLTAALVDLARTALAHFGAAQSQGARR